MVARLVVEIVVAFDELGVTPGTAVTHVARRPGGDQSAVFAEANFQSALDALSAIEKQSSTAVTLKSPHFQAS